MAYPYERMRPDAPINENISSGMIADMKTREVLLFLNEEPIRQPELQTGEDEFLSPHSIALENDRLFTNMFWLIKQALTR
ncbi:hypothetical protein GCM10007874_22140 [Labrys miyagiensis]|uniref:Uncharacterized protein n=1 Tax=Labrys miyagiensis TaxID=346912 RepID=A0ABQ6CLQ3_9HYPH|nr:hypothetical protein [Labrys miyagiensis]GLS19197.1 hypothetical protein GCM10007874_22140 [Labrys miyagiensis]